MTADLRQIWQEAFGDSDETLGKFAATGFCASRCHYICEEAVPVSALYWFDCELEGKRLAYIYGVATRKSHRGQGLARQLLDALKNYAMEIGCSSLELNASDAGYPVYKKYGFTDVANEMKLKISD